MGAGVSLKDVDYTKRASFEVNHVPGIVASDSKGGYDAVTTNEGPYLGLSNIRSAIQAFQLKENFDRENSKLIWLAGDWNISDALTKKSAECRHGLKLFLKTNVWQLKFDPAFIVSARKLKQQGRGAMTEMRKQLRYEEAQCSLDVPYVSGADVIQHMYHSSVLP